MAARLKSPSTFSDGILIRELRRRISYEIGDRTDILLDQVEQRLRSRGASQKLEGLGTLGDEFRQLEATFYLLRDDVVRLLDSMCVECGRPWRDESERWKTYLTDDGEPALYCPECAEREFES